MSKLLLDIQAQPAALAASLEYLTGEGVTAVGRAVRLLRDASDVYISGMGSSMHAGLAVQAMLLARGRSSCWIDSSELLLCGPRFTRNALIMMLSRSGRSIEVTQAARSAIDKGATVLAITNDPDSPLAGIANVVLEMRVPPDHNVSVKTYTAAALSACFMVRVAYDGVAPEFAAGLRESILGSGNRIIGWQSQLEFSRWLTPERPAYFLGRGVSAASAFEAQMMWEEAAKCPASAMTTGEFRHGPQEIVTTPGAPLAIFLHGSAYRETDLQIAQELHLLGARVLVIGQQLPAGLPYPALEIPAIDPEFQFATEIIPAQLAAERLAHLRGFDCDTFRFASFVVESLDGINRS